MSFSAKWKISGIGISKRELIGDRNLSASSELIDASYIYAAHGARLHGPLAWCPRTTSQEECLEIDLGHIHTIGAVAIQGLNQKWTKTFSMNVSKERALWEKVKFQVNSNRDITQ